MSEPSKTRILVVDDEITVCKSIRQVLLSEDVEVDTALSGEEALKKDEDTSFDVVITDLMMPGISGLELLERLKVRRPAVSLIMITGYPTIKTAVQAVKLGAFDYLPKPFTPAELRSLVSRAHRKAGGADEDPVSRKMPAGLHYMLGHTWLKTEKGATGRVGVVHEFSRTLPPLKQVELPEKGSFVAQGEMCARVIGEDGLVHRIWSPAGGRIIEVNSQLPDEPSLLKTSPYHQGWIFRLETSNLDEDLKGLIQSK
ncbi:MAG: response regulator [Candidatus Aminicenantes bacterium]|nr:response regulator [Candidatus Aminicenantes bacterium]